MQPKGCRVQPQGKHEYFSRKESESVGKNIQTSPEPREIKEEAETPKLKEKPKQRKKVKRTRIVNDAHRVPEDHVIPQQKNNVIGYNPKGNLPKKRKPRIFRFPLFQDPLETFQTRLY